MRYKENRLTTMDKRKKAVLTTTHSLNKHDKGNEKISQLKILAQCFSESPKTMYQAERETGIRIANICRFVDRMKKGDCIRKVYIGRCPISHRKAGFYTSNREYFKDDKQLSLFDILWKGVKR